MPFRLKEPLAFWRAVWADLLGRLQQLTADDIVALAAAERPSPPTVKVVQATLHLVGKPPGDVQVPWHPRWSGRHATCLPSFPRCFPVPLFIIRYLEEVLHSNQKNEAGAQS